MIDVLNGYKSGWIGTDKYYIGRKNTKLKLEESPLANTYIVDVDGTREQVVRFYSIKLARVITEAIDCGKPSKMFSTFLDLVIRYKNGEDIHLMCYCSPKLCHGSVVKDFILDYANRWDNAYIEQLTKRFKE